MNISPIDILDEIGALHWTVIGEYIIRYLNKIDSDKVHENGFISPNNLNWRFFMELFNGRKFPSSYQTFKLHYDQMYQSEGARSVDIQAPGSDVYIYPKCKAELLQDVC